MDGAPEKKIFLLTSYTKDIKKIGHLIKTIRPNS